jgi:hypothetical protein
MILQTYIERGVWGKNAGNVLPYGKREVAAEPERASIG